MTDRQIWVAARSLALIRGYVEENGATVLFVPVPNKNTAYPEYMPDSTSPGMGATNYDRLMSALAEQNVPALDLRPVFDERRDEVQLYHRLDSHWNNLGAALAHDAVLEALGRKTQAYDPSAFVVRRDHEPDLYRMLYPSGTERDDQWYLKREDRFSYLRPIRSPEDLRIQTSSETGTGTLLMFRDSFGNTLHRFMAEEYADATFSRLMPYDLRLMKTTHPDTVVLEITERHLSWLAQRPPILPAPVCEEDLCDAVSTEEIVVTITGEDNGLYQLSGELPRDPDPDSPVWLETGDTIYEASAAGETERSFTAYLSAPITSLRVCWRSEGTLCGATASLNER